MKKIFIIAIMSLQSLNVFHSTSYAEDNFIEAVNILNKKIYAIKLEVESQKMRCEHNFNISNEQVDKKINEYNICNKKVDILKSKRKKEIIEFITNSRF